MRDIKVCGQLLVRSLAAEQLAQAHFGPAEMVNLVHRVKGHADGLALAGERAADALANLEHAVSRELRALARVEAIHCEHEADVALVDEVEER